MTVAEHPGILEIDARLQQDDIAKIIDCENLLERLFGYRFHINQMDTKEGKVGSTKKS